jgi:nitrogen fixation NifU-like protein
VILEHYRDPHGRAKVDDATAVAEGLNPACGDELVLALRVENGLCTGVEVNGRGCAFSVASGSILFDLIEGQSVEHAQRVLAAVRGVLLGGPVAHSDVELGDFDALEGVKHYPVRIKCALLPWTTLEEALRMASENGSGHAKRSSL